MQINIPPKDIIEATLKVGVVYKFDAPELITTKVPHYFIVVGIENNDNYLVVCTTQRDSKIDYIKKRGHHLDTLAYLPPTESNGLTDETYVNCNDSFVITKADLIDKVQFSKFKLTGNLSEEEYAKVTKSIGLSHVSDIPAFLLIYPK